tara:strand:- start:381 stop:980 length:600 start_codon:yes stop_codon:yes gene_type:complete
MSLTTYSELQSSIADWLNRTDLTSQIKDFITIAESRLERDLKSPLNEKIANLSVSSESETTIPSDYVEAKDIFYKKVPLTRVSLGELYTYPDQSGTPTCFARKGEKFVFFPNITSVVSGDLQINYYYTIPRLSDTNTSNVVFNYSPELYLYGALKEAALFLQQDPSVWESKYEESFAILMRHVRQAETSGSTAIVESGY